MTDAELCDESDVDWRVIARDLRMGLEHRNSEIAGLRARVAELEAVSEDHRELHRKYLVEIVENQARAERTEAALKEQLETKKWYTDRYERAQAALAEALELIGELNGQVDSLS